MERAVCVSEGAEWNFDADFGINEVTARRFSIVAV